MTSPILEKGQTFATRENITNVKLHNLIDLAGWSIEDQTVGDMVYFDGIDWVRIPLGSEGDVLTLVSGVPTWVTP
jgi:hypothetical protein